MKLLETIWNQFVSTKITEEIFTGNFPIFHGIKHLVLCCDQQIKAVQISYICVLTASQFTQNRELKQPYRDVPLKAVGKPRGVPLNSYSVFFSQNSQEFTSSRTSFLMICIYLRPLLQKYHNTTILHVGTNNCVNESSRVVVDKILNLKTFIQNSLPHNFQRYQQNRWW